MTDKILYANKIFFEYGFTDYQRLTLLALIDHESAGTWSPTVVGDAGCSIGIGQWNWCASRIAADGYEAQVNQLAEEFVWKFGEYDDLQAAGKHNWPARDYNTEYIEKIKTTMGQFYKSY